jgi:hypothetical protein
MPSDSFRPVRTLGVVPGCCPDPSGLAGDRSLGWLPAWLPHRQIDSLLANRRINLR